MLTVEKTPAKSLIVWTTAGISLGVLSIIMFTSTVNIVEITPIDNGMIVLRNTFLMVLFTVLFGYYGNKALTLWFQRVKRHEVTIASFPVRVSAIHLYSQLWITGWTILVSIAAIASTASAITLF